MYVNKHGDTQCLKSAVITACQVEALAKTGEGKADVVIQWGCFSGWPRLFEARHDEYRFILKSIFMFIIYTCQRGF
jgi:hypothetical protein